MGRNRVPIRGWAGKVVGHVLKDEYVFEKRVRGSLHFLRVRPGIATDTCALDAAEAAGARTIRVLDTEKGRWYVAPFSVLRDKGEEIDLGQGTQILLRLQFWTMPGKGRQLPLFTS